MIFKIFLPLFIFISLNSYAEEKLTENAKYRNVLINYSKVLFEEFCHSGRTGGCLDQALENFLGIQFEKATVGEYKIDEGTIYYVISPIKSGGTALTMFFRKTSGSLESCGSAETAEEFNTLIKNVKAKTENLCATEEGW